MAEGPSKSFMLNALEEDSSYQPGNNHLLLIGIDAYDHHNRLNNARRDAEAMRDLLLKHYEFVPERTHELFDKDATLRNIIEILEDLEDRLTPEDNLLIYFSGHGTMNRRRSQGFWVPVDAEKTTAHYLPNDRVRAIIRDMEAHHIYLIVDACFSGSTILRSETSVHELMEENPSRRALTSGRKEVVSDGKPGGHSPFFDCIRHQLDKRLPISAVELENYVIHNTPRTADQLPEAAFIFGLGDKSGKFVFRPKRNQEADYQAAMKAGSSQAWKTFLQAYPDSPHKAEIVTRIADLQEQEAWTEAQRLNSITAYRSYRQQFPDGAHRSEALDNIEQLEANRDWNKAQRQHTISGYERFLDSHPRCQQRSEAKAAIEGLLASEQKAANKRSKPLAAAAGLPQQQAAVPQRRYALDWRIPAGVVTLALLIALGFWAAKDKEPVQDPVPDNPVTIVDTFDSTMVLIEGGTFTMGSNERDNEKPHQVTLSDFYIGKYEVTQAQWKAVMGTNPSAFTGCDQCPVENVSWEDIQLFIDKLNPQTERTYRLPTEAEWEYAAGGGASNRTMYAGTNDEDSLEKYAWYHKNAKGKTHPVGEKLPNGLGLYDMSGNVWEWCHDRYGSGYYSNSPSQDPAGPPSGAYRVLRGGSWGYGPQGLRVAFRSSYSPGYRYRNVGFRLSRTL